MAHEKTFNPDYVIGPHETIKELMEYYGYNETELAIRLERSQSKTNLLINGKVPISNDLAIKLEQVLGVPASFWINNSLEYQQYLEKDKPYDETESILADAKIYRQLVKMQLVNATNSITEMIEELRKFFGVATLKSIAEVYSRKCIGVSFKCDGEVSKNMPLFTWIRMVEKEQSEQKIPPYNEMLLKKNLNRIKEISREEEPTIFLPQLCNLCFECGVALVLVPEIKGIKVYGMTYWANDDRPILALSFRRKTLDSFWFALFHEIGHILLHKSKKWIIEADELKDKKEDEANEFAADNLIPQSIYNEMIQCQPVRETILLFANKAKVHPAIVLGRLQHDNIIPYSKYSDMIPHYKWKHEV